METTASMRSYLSLCNEKNDTKMVACASFKVHLKLSKRVSKKENMMVDIIKGVVAMGFYYCVIGVKMISS